MRNLTATSAPARRDRKSTATANFGSGRREGHDASAFYQRFTPPVIADDSTISAAGETDVIRLGDARDMASVASNSVGLVVTSPPYFAGKQYEQDLGVNGVPADYVEYLELLRDVFAECKRVLEPGGRIAVNVANLGRRPYRSLSGDVTNIFGDLGLLLRGEVIWCKGRAAGGSCAWGTFQRPANPVLRDVTERVVIAAKGRFDRALSPAERHRWGLPSTATISRDEFMDATTDLWEIAPESATRVGHPAPFPVELPRRLIELYTYQGDVVLDPFMGSGSTAVAAVRTGRRYLGFDTDDSYVKIAQRRVETEHARLGERSETETRLGVHLPAVADDDGSEDLHTRAVREGRQARDLAEVLLGVCGFHNIRPEVKPRGAGIVLSFVAADSTGADWAFDVSGAFASNRSGLKRTDVLFRALGKAAVLAEHQAQQPGPPMPLVLLTTDAPLRGTAPHQALQAMQGPNKAVFDVVGLLNASDRGRLQHYAVHGRHGLEHS